MQFGMRMSPDVHARAIVIDQGSRCSRENLPGSSGSSAATCTAGRRSGR
jgi:hypothetical protein